jgi:Rieske Fe-S protein
MNIDRKQFLFLTAAICAGCKSLEEGPGTGAGATGQTRVVDAGPATAYAADGVYQNFGAQGFFVVRKGPNLVAVSSYCTHRRCKLTAEPDRSFYCDCHGSTFDPAGKVTHGPAIRDLPVFPSVKNAAGHLMVTVQA